MFEQLTSSPFFIGSIIFVTLGLIVTFAGIVSLIKAQVGSFTVRTLLGLVFLLSGVLAGLVAFGMQGYQALTKEVVAAHISVSPIAPQKFVASFRFPDGRKANFIIYGDEINVEAHILKWQPLANLFGLHTAYELDRVSGRYRDLEQERTAERSIYSLSTDKSVKLFNLRQRYTFLTILLDAKYGSASFIPVTQAAELELRVSTTALLIREVGSTTK
jgi:hypothetical protein